MLFRRLFRSSVLGFAAAYFMDRKRGAARRAKAMRLGRSLKAKAISQLDARRASRLVTDPAPALAPRTGVR